MSVSQKLYELLSPALMTYLDRSTTKAGRDHLSAMGNILLYAVKTSGQTLSAYMQGDSDTHDQKRMGDARLDFVAHMYHALASHGELVCQSHAHGDQAVIWLIDQLKEKPRPSAKDQVRQQVRDTFQTPFSQAVTIVREAGLLAGETESEASEGGMDAKRKRRQELTTMLSESHKNLEALIRSALFAKGYGTEDVEKSLKHYCHDIAEPDRHHSSPYIASAVCFPKGQKGCAVLSTIPDADRIAIYLYDGAALPADATFTLARGQGSQIAAWRINDYTVKNRDRRRAELERKGFTIEGKLTTKRGKKKTHAVKSVGDIPLLPGMTTDSEHPNLFAALPTLTNRLDAIDPTPDVLPVAFQMTALMHHLFGAGGIVYTTYTLHHGISCRAILILLLRKCFPKKNAQPPNRYLRRQDGWRDEEKAINSSLEACIEPILRLFSAENQTAGDKEIKEHPRRRSCNQGKDRVLIAERR